MISERIAWAGSDFTCTGLKKPVRARCARPRASRIGLVGRQRLERLVGLPALDTDHGEAELTQPMEQDRRHASGLEHDPTTARRFRQLVGDRPSRRRRLALVNDRAFAADNADVGLVHRDIEASKILP